MQVERAKRCPMETTVKARKSRAAFKPAVKHAGDVITPMGAAAAKRALWRAMARCEVHARRRAAENAIRAHVSKMSAV